MTHRQYVRSIRTRHAVFKCSERNRLTLPSACMAHQTFHEHSRQPKTCHVSPRTERGQVRQARENTTWPYQISIKNKIIRGEAVQTNRSANITHVSSALNMCAKEANLKGRTRGKLGHRAYMQ
jgi:hypothetical protein